MKFCPYCGKPHEREASACCREHGYKAAGMAAGVTRARNKTRRDYMAALQARLRNVPTFRRAALGELTPEQTALAVFGVEPAPSFFDPSEGQP